MKKTLVLLSIITVIVFGIALFFPVIPYTTTIEVFAPEGNYMMEDKIWVNLREYMEYTFN